METALFTKIFKERTLEKTFELTADLGYDAVELMCREPHFSVDTTDDRAKSLKDQLDDLGLAVAGLGTYTGNYVGVTDAEAEAELADLERFLELSDIMETELLRHGVGGPPERDASEAQYAQAAEWYRKAADLAADYGKTLGIEIHAHTIAESAGTAAELIDRIDRPNVGAIHDAGNMYIVGADFGASSIERLGNRLVHVHVKDMLRIKDPDRRGALSLETERGEELFVHRLLGHGGTDHTELVEALAERGYNGYLSNECHRPTDRIWTDETIAAHEFEALDRLITTAA